MVYNTGCSEHGDSGGPWYFSQYAMGIDVGYTNYLCKWGPAGGSWFDEIQATEEALGLNVVG